MNKKIVLLSVLVIVVLALVAWFMRTKTPSNQAVNPALNQNQEQKPALKVETSAVEEKQLPKEFPSDLPLEANAKILGNYNATSEDGTYQATRTFESKKSMEENFSLFKKYLQDKGWEIVATKEDKNSSAIGAKKNNASLDFGFTKSATGVVVDISFSVK